jgi:hypothetical protein
VSPKTFQLWGAHAGEIANKVPSRVAYDRRTGELKAWGFQCEPDDLTADLREYFKLYLDPGYRDEFQDLTNADAKHFYHDYLRCIHDHLAHYFVSTFPQWTAQTVEWVFSVPTTWYDPGIIHSLDVLIKSAGFGRDGASHTCRITLTEAEAAAICVARQYLEVRLSFSPSWAFG